DRREAGARAQGIGPGVLRAVQEPRSRHAGFDEAAHTRKVRIRRHRAGSAARMLVPRRGADLSRICGAMAESGRRSHWTESRMGLPDGSRERHGRLRLEEGPQSKGRGGCLNFEKAWLTTPAGRGVPDALTRDAVKSY